MTAREAIYRAALEHIRDGSDAVCTECGWMGDIDVAQRVGEVPSFLCPQCRAIAIEYGERKIAAYALAQGGRGGVMNIYLSSSWKNRDRVRALAMDLRRIGHEVYDFTDPACRKSPEIPPERFPEEFDPERHDYAIYLSRPEWIQAVQENRKAIQRADLIILMLPCGNDSHADWALGVGMGKRSIVVGCPRPGERSPVHHWAEAILPSDVDALVWVAKLDGLEVFV